MRHSDIRSWFRKNAVVIPAAFLFAVIATDGLITYRKVRVALPQVEKARISYEVIDALSTTVTDVLDAETGQRGFLLTGQPEYLQSYVDASRRMPADIHRLDEIARVDPAQYERFLTFRGAIGAKIAELRQSLDSYSSGGRQAALAIVATDRGRTLMDEIRRTADAMETDEERVLAVQRQETVITGNHALAMIVVTTTFAALFLVLTFVYIARGADAQELARNRAENANRIKDEFIATVSHELRTPLTAILGWSQMLASYSGDPALVREGLSAIHNCASAQAKVIDDLLDVSRILTGKLTLSSRTIDIAGAVRAGIDSVRPSAAAKGVTIVPVLENDIRITGDPDRLQQVVWNLLTNAVKFTKRGGAVHVALTRSESQAIIEVNDSGEGIDAEFLPHVFEPFRQADGSKARIHKGLGLGLSIVKHLVEAHGGTIAVSSAGIGQGSTFRVALPIMPFVQSEPGGELPQISASDFDEVPLRLLDRDALKNTTILVVDDHVPTLDVLTSVLRRAGADTVSARSAAEALRLFHGVCPDVVLSDIGMPGEDGMSLIAKIRALPQPCAQAHAIALTAYTRTDDRNEILASGFDTYLSKPVEPVALVNAIQQLLGDRATR